MNRPRRSFGNQPGQLVATMLRALAAEVSDPGRYSRAKAYARDGAVIEIDIRPEVVSGLVLGSRREPYEVLLTADPAPIDEIERANPAQLGSLTMLVPGRDELAVSCSCPDADGTPGLLCKHAIAVLLVLADEASIEPDLLVRWRSADAEGGRGRMRVSKLPRPRTAPSVAPPPGSIRWPERSTRPFPSRTYRPSSCAKSLHYRPRSSTIRSADWCTICTTTPSSR